MQSYHKLLRYNNNNIPAYIIAPKNTSEALGSIHSRQFLGQSLTETALFNHDSWHMTV